MEFNDFVAHFHSIFEKVIGLGGMWGHIPSIKESSIFRMGEGSEVTSVLDKINQDLYEDMKSSIPFPFPDVCLVFDSEDASSLCRMIYPVPKSLDAQFGEGVHAVEVNGVDTGIPVTVTQRIALLCMSTHRETKKDFMLPGIVEFRGVVRDEDGSSRLWFRSSFHQEAFLKAHTFESEGRNILLDTAIQNYPKIAYNAIRWLTAISHPANYIVRTTPTLTEKEDRRFKKFGTRPSAKLPHYIVIDHDVMVDLQRKRASDGTHSSPIPHFRRGHWMRLSERCSHARESGAERVWVRDTFVGETEFSDERNAYKVLLDFGKRPLVTNG